uniref:Ubiquitin-like protease family profile domain-containing protein n=1 Tax=Brassica oleracea var. oleracea TaxID=109376 RepID=A0A0D3AQS4_BRAOL
MEHIRDLKKAMSAEYNDVKIDPVFKHIMAIAENKLKLSGKLVDSFLCKQLITSKMHEKWFVFARTPLRPLRIGPTMLDAEIGTLLMDRTEWLHNLEIDAKMYVFRERTSLKRWELHRVAFMSAVFSNMIKKEYESFKAGIRKYKLHHLLLPYGKGVLPPHGRTQEIWNVDVDRLYVPVHVSGNHWIALCISFVTRSIDVFDCSGRKRYKELDAFANLVPRIVKAVQPPRYHKDFNVAAYTFIECHSLGLKLSLVNDGNIKEARHKVLWDLWEAANDPELVDRMSNYEPPECLSSTVEEIM